MLCMSANHRYCSLWMMPSIFDGFDLSACAAHALTHSEPPPRGSSVIFEIFPNEPISGFPSERPVNSRQAVWESITML